MNNPIIYQAAAALLFLFFAVSTYWFAKSWKWHHILALWCVMLSGLFFSYYAAVAEVIRVSWAKVHAENEKRLQTAIDDKKKLVYGDLHEIIQTEETVRSLQSKVARQLVDRGRVWRGCIPGQMSPNGTVTLTVISQAPPAPIVDPAAAASAPAAVPAAAGATPPAEGAPAPAPAAPAIPESHRIEKKSILYVYAEGQGPQAGIPIYYIGEFKVTDTTDTTLTVAPMLAFGLQPIPPGPWTLYEAMPVDSYDAFADLKSAPDDEHLFGVVNEQELRAMMPKVPGQTDEKYEAMIRSYLRNGTAAKDDDPPENIWFQIKFLKDFEVQVDAETSESLLDNRFFDNTGRAVVATLQRGEPAKFKANDFAFVNQDFANQIVAQGVAEKVKAIYVRKLHDYWYAFHDISDRMKSIAVEFERIQRNAATLDESNKRTLEQIATREQEKRKLQEDLTNVQRERDIVLKHLDVLRTKWDESKAYRSKLYQGNVALAEELARLAREATNRVTPSTASSGPTAQKTPPAPGTSSVTAAQTAAANLK